MSSLSLAAVQNLPTLTAVADKRKVKTRTCDKGECVSPDVREVPLMAWDQRTIPSTHPLHNALPAPPTTARAFKRSETIVLFAEVYDNKGARPLGVRAELRQPNRAPALLISQQLAASTSRASGGYGVTLSLPLAEVSPGRYVLRLEATASSEHVAAREIPVDVLP
jgi:hypothetical protein